MLNESSTVTACGPPAWRSMSVRPRHGRISASLPWTRWLRLSLVLICTVRSQLLSACEGARAVRCGLGEVAAQADEDLGATFEHGVDRLDHVVAVFTRHLEREAPLKGIEERHGRALVDAHGAVALHVAVAAHRAQAGAGLADVAAQQHQVGDFLDGRHRMTMLGDAHRPAHDHVLAFGVHARRLLDLDQGQAGLLDDLLPGRVVDNAQVYPARWRCVR